MDVFRPTGGGPLPAILWLHGGALILGARGNLAPAQRELYLRQGYAVAAADYRLAPETRLPDILRDVGRAYAWLRARGAALFDVDPARVAVVGHSAGAYLALMAGATFEPRPRAIVSFYGYGDIVGPWYSRPAPHYCAQPLVSEEEARRAVGTVPVSSGPWAPRFRFYLRCRQQGTWPQEVTGHDPDKEPGWFDAYCPVRNVSAAYPPTLLIHGEEDTDVPCARSREMAAELARHGVAHELVTLPGRGHAFDHSTDACADPVVAHVYGRVLGFLATHC